MTELKPLPRNKSGEIERTFTANGTTYKILDVGKVLSPRRYTEFTRMSAVVGFGLDFTQLQKALIEVQKLIFDIDPLNSITKKGAVLRCEALLDSVVKASQERYEQAMYHCTLFIVTPDEDLREWDFDEATKKIDDWAAEGFNVVDFFFLAVTTIPQFLQVWQDTKREMTDRIININLGAKP